MLFENMDNAGSTLKKTEKMDNPFIENLKGPRQSDHTMTPDIDKQAKKLSEKNQQLENSKMKIECFESFNQIAIGDGIEESQVSQEAATTLDQKKIMEMAEKMERLKKKKDEDMNVLKNDMDNLKKQKEEESEIQKKLHEEHLAEESRGIEQQKLEQEKIARHNQRISIERSSKMLKDNNKRQELEIILLKNLEKQKQLDLKEELEANNKMTQEELEMVKEAEKRMRDQMKQMVEEQKQMAIDRQNKRSETNSRVSSK